MVPPSGGSLEIGNPIVFPEVPVVSMVPPSGGSLEIGNLPEVGVVPTYTPEGSPFGGIPRNWKLGEVRLLGYGNVKVPPSGGSLEIGNP